MADKRCSDDCHSILDESSENGTEVRNCVRSAHFERSGEGGAPLQAHPDSAISIVDPDRSVSYFVDSESVSEYNNLLERWLNSNACNDSTHRPRLRASVKELHIGSEEHWNHFLRAVEVSLQSSQSPPPFQTTHWRGLKAKILDLIEARVLDEDEKAMIRKNFRDNCSTIYEKKTYIRRIMTHVHVLLGQRVDMFSIRRGQRWSDLDEKWKLFLENVDYQLSMRVQAILDQKPTDLPTPEVVNSFIQKRELVRGEFCDSDDELSPGSNFSPCHLTNADLQRYNDMLREWTTAHGADGSFSRPFLGADSSTKPPRMISRLAWEEFIHVVQRSLDVLTEAPKYRSFRAIYDQIEIEALVRERMVDESDRKKILSFIGLKWEIFADPNAQFRRIRLLTAIVLGTSFPMLILRSGQSLKALERPWRHLLDHLEARLTAILSRAFDVDQSDVQVVRADKVPASSSRIADRVATVDVLENEVDGEMDLVRSMERLTLHDDAAVQEQVSGYSTNQFFIFWTPQTNNNNSKTFISQKNCSSQITNDPKTFITQKRTDLFYTAMASHGATAIQKRNPMSASASFDDLKKRLIERPIGDKRGSMVDDQDDDAIKLARNADKWQRIRRPRSGSSDED